jgi:outer membrane biosynthesis protein TonB
MDPISLALLAINGLSTILSNPALGGGSSVKLGQASELLGILGALISQGDDALDDLKAFTETIEEMAAKGRAPTAGEWDVMRARSDDAHERLQAAKEELLAEEEPEEPEVTTEPEEPVTDPTPAVETLPTEEPVVEPPEEDDPPPTG